MKKSILKNAAKVFRRYGFSLPSLKWRFMVPDNISSIREKLYRKSFRGNKIKGFLFFMLAVGPFPRTNNFKDDIQFLVSNFTLDETQNEAIDEYIKSLKSAYRKKLFDVTYSDRNKLTLKIKDREIVAQRMTYVFPALIEKEPEILTTERYHKCHEKSHMLIYRLEGKNKAIATGTIATVTKDCKFLHSWIEEEESDGSVWWYDFTNNIAMKKEDFYWLYDVKLYERISMMQLEEDDKKLMYLHKNMKFLPKRNIMNDQYFSKLWFSHHDEALKKIDKSLKIVEKKKQTLEK